MRRTLLRLVVSALIATLYPVAGQSPPAQGSVAELKGKYLWGNMFLTYSVDSELASLTKNQTKLQKIPQEEQDALRLLAKLLTPYYETPINRAIGVVVLDLNVDRAGFKCANDINGAISQIPWSPREVEVVAILCDKCLSGIKIVQEAQAKITDESSSVQVAWNTFQNLNDNPYVSDVRVASLKIDLAQALQNRSTQLKELESQNPQLFTNIRSFADTFDKQMRTSVAEVKSVDAATNTIVAKEDGKAPATFPYSTDSTIIVDRAGKELAAAKIEPGSKVGIEFSTSGEDRSATKVVVGKSGDSDRALEKAVAAVSDASSTYGTTTTASTGTITEYTPGASVVILGKSQGSGVPVRYTFEKEVAFVTPNGNPIKPSAIEPDSQVRLQYVKEGDQRL